MSHFQAQSDSPFIKQQKIIIALPIITGVFIFVLTNTVDWLSLWIEQNKIPKGGVSGFVIGSLIEGPFHIIPFIIITAITKDLFRRHIGKTEIYIKLSLILIPVSIFTAYWLFIQIDPFARGLTLFINFALILFGIIIGKLIIKNKKS